MSPPVVEARGVTRTFPMPAGPVVAVRDLSVTIAAGEFVSITCGQANLNRTVRAAALEPGNLFQLTFSDTFKAEKGDGKVFEMKVNRSRNAGVPADSIV